MTIIDAQVHVWPAETPGRRYATEDASKPHRPVPLGYKDLLSEMSGAGVDRAILAPPSWEGYRNDFALEAARKYPERFAVMGKVPLLSLSDKEWIMGRALAKWLRWPLGNQALGNSRMQ